MALPENRIKKIKLPNNTEYTIVPEQLQSNGHSLSAPSLSSDDEIVTLDTNQNIGGNKYFGGEVVLNNNPLKIIADESTSHTNEDWDTNFYPDRLEIENYGDGEGGSETFTLQYPKLAGGETKTFATTDDIKEVEIVDLTDLDHASYRFSLFEENGTTYLRINFSQGYVIGGIFLTNKTIPSSYYWVEFVYNAEGGGSYVIDDSNECSVFGYNMQNKTTGGLQNYLMLDLNDTPASIDDLELTQDINFIKVEGTFEFQL